MSDSEPRTGLPPRPAESAPRGYDEEEPPGSSRRHPRWADVPLDKWEDWRWQAQNAVRSVRQLAELLPHAPDELDALDRLADEYKLAIPPYYFSLIDPDDPHD